MEKTTWIAIYLPLIVLFWILYQQHRAVVRHRAAAIHRRKGAHLAMEAIFLKYLNQGVMVTTISETLTGKLTGYSGGWLTLTDAKGKEECVNGDYVVKIKAYPIKF